MTVKQFTTALQLARQRGMIPSALGSAELQAVFTASMRRRVLVLARVTKGAFLSEVKRAVEDFMAAKLGRSKAQSIAFLQGLLQRLGYDPATGFPGDAALGVPAAEPGSLQDLSSWKRLDLVFETERALANGKAERMNGDTPVARRLFPALELVRIESRDQPRGSIDSGSPSWGTRWVDFGGPAPVVEGQTTHLIAGKDDPIWQRLGDQALYDAHGIHDLAMGTDHPPFAIKSGYGVLPVSKERVKVLNLRLRKGVYVADPAFEMAIVPEVKVEAKSLDPMVAKEVKRDDIAELMALKAEIQARRQERLARRTAA